MKNFFKTLTIVLVMVLGANFSSKAQFNFGGNLGYFAELVSGGYNNPYLQVKAGYLINEQINVRADFTYGFPKKDDWGFSYNITQFMVGASYWLEAGNGGYVYPMASLGSISYRVEGFSLSEFAINLGGGLLFPMGDNLLLGGEASFGLPMGIADARIMVGADVRYVLW